SNWSLIEKGRYTPMARVITRVLDKAGCVQGKVASIILYITGQAGLKVKGRMSCHTVQRAPIKGGVAAWIQLAHEMADAEGRNFFMHQSSLTQIECLGVTLSSDATSGSSHKMRILSLTSTVLHSSETQLKNLEKQICNIADVYRPSPLGQRSALNFEVHNFLRVVRSLSVLRTARCLMAPAHHLHE
ncbi:hypothetical protein DFH08DRAFT_702167, partial [Mycena albidolilacea]